MNLEQTGLSLGRVADCLKKQELQQLKQSLRQRSTELEAEESASKIEVLRERFLSEAVEKHILLLLVYSLCKCGSRARSRPANEKPRRRARRRTAQPFSKGESHPP